MACQYSAIKISMQFIALISLTIFTSLAYSNCLEMFKKYHPNELVRPLERFVGPSQKLYESLSQHNPDAIVSHLIEKDTRQWIFRLEALLRLYKKQAPKLEELLIAIKALEDSIGTHTAYIDRSEFAKTIGADKNVISYLEEQKQETYVELRSLVSNEWDQKGFATFIETLSRHEWLSYEKDKEYLRTRLIKIFKKLRDEDYDLTDLEEGIHELRRQIRWFLIYAHSLEGMLDFHPGVGNSTIKRFNELMKNDELVNSKYVQFFKSEKEDPVYLSFPYYLTASYIVGKIGTIKDNGEAFHSLIEAYLKLGLFETVEQTEKEIHALAHFKGIPIIDTFKEATKLKEFITPEDAINENIYQLMLDELSNDTD